jgi:broad specificity phosphatase PhoE
VELRVRAFVDELQAAQAPEGPRTVALFSHGIAIRSFVRGTLGASGEFTVHAETDNCSLTVLEYRPGPPDHGGLGGWVLKCFNA